MMGIPMDKHVRPSVLAGTGWYPGNPKLLRKTIEQYFDRVTLPPVQGTILGLISPHAGFEFSGQVAAYGYKQLLKKQFDLVVVVSPLHRMFASHYMTTSASFYETPLGQVPVDTESLEALSEMIQLDFVSHDNEHSLEIQLPFLQVALGAFKLIPVMVGVKEMDSCEDIVNGLLKISLQKNVLFIASSDLHHISNYQEVVENDQKVIQTLAGFDLNTIRKTLRPMDCTVCGKVPISIVLDVTKRLGANHCQILKHSNSGEVTGETQPGQYTVGYLSAVILKK
jgi:AmmeMemoRadiSam system protein B